eukprot:6207502-Pleurochrysis_carterae.AAC.5
MLARGRHQVRGVNVWVVVASESIVWLRSGGPVCVLATFPLFDDFARINKLRAAPKALASAGKDVRIANLKSVPGSSRHVS